MNRKVSFIIVAYDNPDHLGRTVETIQSHTDYLNKEIIVSHNKSDTIADEKIKELLTVWNSNWDNFKFVVNDENLYHGKGCMNGYALIDPETEFVVFCNDDIFIPASQSDWLDKMLGFMEEHPEVATLTPSLYSAKETLYWCGKQDPSAPYHDFLHFPKGDIRIPTRVLETCYNNFAVLLTRRFLVDEIPIGQSCPHYGSDSEFCNRIKEKYPVMIHMVIPEIKLYHYNIFNLRTNYGKDNVVKG